MADVNSNHLYDFFQTVLGIFLSLAIVEAIRTIPQIKSISENEIIAAIDARSIELHKEFYKSDSLHIYTYPWRDEDIFRKDNNSVESIKDLPNSINIPYSSIPQQEPLTLVDNVRDVKKSDFISQIVFSLNKLVRIRVYNAIFFILFFLLQTFWVIKNNPLKNIILMKYSVLPYIYIFGFTCSLIALGTFTTDHILHNGLRSNLLLFFLGWLIFDIADLIFVNMNTLRKCRFVIRIKSFSGEYKKYLKQYCWILIDILALIFSYYKLNDGHAFDLSLSTLISTKMYENFILSAIIIAISVEFVKEIRRT